MTKRSVPLPVLGAAFVAAPPAGSAVTPKFRFRRYSASCPLTLSRGVMRPYSGSLAPLLRRLLLGAIVVLVGLLLRAAAALLGLHLIEARLKPRHQVDDFGWLARRRLFVAHLLALHLRLDDFHDVLTV